MPAIAAAEQQSEPPLKQGLVASDLAPFSISKTHVVLVAINMVTDPDCRRSHTLLPERGSRQKVRLDQLKRRDEMPNDHGGC